MKNNDGILVPAVPDDRLCNTDHIPMYKEDVGKYSWSEKNSGGSQIRTGGAEKERFTVQPTITKSGKKLKLFIIFKGAPPPVDGSAPRHGTVAEELYLQKADKHGNAYPPADKVFMACTKTGNSSGELTISILDNVIFPEIGINDGLRGGVLVDDFKGHSKDVVKKFVKGKLYGDESIPDKMRYELCAVLIMAGGITPKSQPIDAFIGKVLKGYYREFYDEYVLTAPINEKTGQIISPTRQLSAQWVVKAWEKIPEEMIRKVWDVCGYKKISEIQNIEQFCNKETTVVTQYSSDEIVSVMEKARGKEAMQLIRDPENEVDEAQYDSEETENDDDGTWDASE